MCIHIQSVTYMHPDKDVLGTMIGKGYSVRK